MRVILPSKAALVKQAKEEYGKHKYGTGSGSDRVKSGPA